MIVGLKIPGFEIRYEDKPLDLFSSFKEVKLNDDLKILAKSVDVPNNLEANFFLIRDNKIESILFGTCVFFKDTDLNEDDINFINDYLKISYLTDREKAMAGLYDYTVKDNVYKIKNNE